MKIKFNASRLDNFDKTMGYVFIAGAISFASLVFIVEVQWHWIFVNLVWIIPLLFYLRNEIITLDVRVIFSISMIIISMGLLFGGIFLGVYLGGLK